jgi:ubiquitin C-terminal hydrolase
MASSLQCLSHATPLTRHFLSNQFLLDLNIANPLGTAGKLAHAYETVLKDIWMKQPDATSPTALKRAIAIFAPRFAGCSQHDAQEFLAYLLDGLHEDLNRIRNAPYVELPDVSGDMNFHVAGAQAWDAHQRRNDSVVMGTFYGQFKSTCVCPTCERVSVSFDAFNHVSLEIPQLHNLTRFVPVMFVSEGVNTRYLVEVKRSGFVGDLRNELSLLCGVPVLRLSLCDVFEHSIYDILKDNKQLSVIRTSDIIVAYEVDPYTNSTIHAIGTNGLALANQPESDEVDGDKAVQKELFGYPFLVSFPADLTCRQVWERMWSLIKNHVDEEQRDLLTIRVVDNTSKPKPIFLDANVGTTNEDASALSPTNDEKLATYLGEGCTERFLFIALEWRNREQVESREEPERPEAMSLDPDKFVESTFHPSYAKALEKQRASNSFSKGVTLDQCFDTFTRPERLDENNMWYCSKCKEHVRAMKTMELWKLPNILVVHLKRFEFKHALRRDKLDTFVDFPLDGLDMSSHCASARRMGKEVVDDSVDATYDLFGVTNHYGRLGFGHYTAFARKWDEEGMSKEWSLFDDSTVRCVGDGRGRDDGVVTPSAYVLFYRRRTFT